MGTSPNLTNPSYFAPAYYRVFGSTSLADNVVHAAQRRAAGPLQRPGRRVVHGGSCNPPHRTAAPTT